MNGRIVFSFVKDWFRCMWYNPNNFESVKDEYLNTFYEYTKNDDDASVMFACITGNLSGMTKSMNNVKLNKQNFISFSNYPEISKFVVDWCSSVFELGISFGMEKEQDCLEEIQFMKYVKERNQSDEIFIRISDIVLQLSQMEQCHEGDSQ